MKIYNNLKIPIQISIPTVVSKMIVAKYHMHASLSSFNDNFNEITTFKQWARNWETACLEVSINQIFQGLFGCYLYRL